MNIVDIIRDETREHRGKPALIDGARSISYQAFFDAIDMTAKEMASNGIGNYDRVALLCAEGIEYVVVSCAILSVNAVVVPITPSLKEHEIEQILREMKVNVFIFDREMYGRADSTCVREEALQSPPLCMRWYARNESITDEYAALEPAFIRFSSGTTGESKGVVISHEAIVARTDAANKGLKITADDTVLWVLSMAFHFVVTILLFLRKSATIVLAHNDFPHSLRDGLTMHNCTFLYASPFHYKMMCSMKNMLQGKFSSVRMAVSTAMKLPDTVADEFLKTFDVPLTEAYGIIEVGLPFLNDDPQNAGRGTVGKALSDYEVRIAADNPGEEGVIFLKGPGMFSAYFSPWELSEDITREGWFNTGDIGTLDDEHNLYIIARAKSVINFAGMKIFPDEVESVLTRCPGIAEALVFAEQHDLYGEMPCARIVLSGDAADVNEDTVREFCYARLEKYKVPKEIEFVSCIPKTASGKIMR